MSKRSEPKINIGNVVQEGDPVLRGVADPIPVGEIKSLKIERMIKALSEELAHHEDGIAIAAPQMGFPVRLFVVSRKIHTLEQGEVPPEISSPEWKKAKDLVFINPRILKLSKKKIWIPEGCLSVRWLYGEHLRAEKAQIEAYDEHGKKFTRGASGLLAQIFQHETDHLNGILFIDHARKIERMPPPKKGE